MVRPPMTKPRLTIAEPGRFRIDCHASPPTVYPEEVHATIQVCVPFERARFAVTRQSETGRAVIQQLGARDALVVPVRQPHAVDWRAPAHILSAHFTASFLEEITGGRDVRLRDTFTLRDPFLFSAASQLRAVLEADEPASSLVVGAMATAIAFRVVQGAESSEGAEGEGARRLAGPTCRALSPRECRTLTEYIDAHLDETMTLAQLAQVVNLSHWHFLRCFKATFGVAPHAYLTQRRLARAQELLARSSLRIVDIALEIGMSHTHFSRTFLGRFGVSPREYRLRQRR